MSSAKACRGCLGHEVMIMCSGAAAGIIAGICSGFWVLGEHSAICSILELLIAPTPQAGGCRLKAEVACFRQHSAAAGLHTSCLLYAAQSWQWFQELLCSAAETNSCLLADVLQRNRGPCWQCFQLPYGMMHHGDIATQRVSGTRCTVLIVCSVSVHYCVVRIRAGRTCGWKQSCHAVCFLPCMPCNAE